MQPAQRRVLTFVTLVLLISLCGQAASAQTTERVSVASDGTQANFLSFSPAISADGRFVAFVSAASNLVARDTNGTGDVSQRGIASWEAMSHELETWPPRNRNRSKAGSARGWQQLPASPAMLPSPQNVISA